LFSTREILLGKSLRLKHGWVAVVNRGQADINKKMTMSESRGKEQEFFKGVDQYRCACSGRAAQHK
jgi:dynamin 1-like protein